MKDHHAPQTEQKKSWDPPKATVVPVQVEERLMFCNFNASSQCTYQSAN